MDEDVQMILDMAKEAMEKAINHLENELSKIRAGKASPVMLEGIKVEAYGSPTPIQQVSSISAPDPRLLTIQPWDKSMIGPIERAILSANLGLNPSNDGQLIRVPIPSLNEERRKGLVKQAKDEGEHARIGIRAARKSANDEIKALVKDGLSEDMGKKGEDAIQALTTNYGDSVDKHLKKKEEEIMTV
jgi:ribosome recycling factor